MKSRRISAPVAALLGGLAILAAPAAAVCQLDESGAGRPSNLDIRGKQLDIPPPPDDPRANAVVERYIEAIGGRAMLDAVQDRTVTFETIKHAMAGDTKAELTLYLKRGFKVREEWDLPGFKIADKKLQFVQVYDGFDGWVQMFGTVSPIEGRTLSIFVWDKPIDDFFCHWKEDGYTLTYVDEGEVKGEPVDIVMTTDFHGKGEVKHFFSKQSGLLLKKEWKDVDQKGAVTKSNYFEMYRDIPFKTDPSKKVKVSLHQKIYIEDDLDTERRYTRVVFNQGLNDAIFERPEGVEFAGGIGRGARTDGVDPRQVFEQYEPDSHRAVSPTAGPAASGDAPEGSTSKTKTGPTPVQIPTSKGTNPHEKK